MFFGVNSGECHRKNRLAWGHIQSVDGDLLLQTIRRTATARGFLYQNSQDQ